MAREDKIILYAQDILKFYPHFTLKVERLSLEEEKVYFLLGPNGSGKTTLLRILSGLDKPDRGKVFFKRQDVHNNHIKIYPELSFIPTNPYLFKGSVIDNIAYGLRLKGLSKKEVEKRIKDLCERLKVSDLLEKDAKKLSSGEAQIVALIRSLVLFPKLLLLDEPTSNLDIEKARLLEEVILEYKKEYKITLLWSTHNIFQAQKLADDIFYLWNGEIIEENKIPWEYSRFLY
ncbi:MAG: ABC transporter ATP-binding protein [Dictyoglomaceae bacterium]